MMDVTSVCHKPITGRKVLLTLVGFFGIVFSVNMLMMKLAIDTLSGTEVDSAYKSSLAYESEIIAARDQNVRNWRIDVQVSRESDGSASLRVEAHDSKGEPLTKVGFVGRLERPINKRADKQISLTEVAGGIYRGEANDIGPGQWDLVIEGDVQNKRLFLSKSRVVLH